MIKKAEKHKEERLENLDFIPQDPHKKGLEILKE
jgi:hypothetical protein